MRSLEEEARIHANLNEDFDYEAKINAYMSFQAGANSKWVQAEKIKAQIEVLKEAYNKPSQTMNMLVDLEQQLKQLEDENI